jgi:transposase InsO family protein
MLSAIVNACKSFFHQIKTAIKQFSKPETAVLATGAASDVTRSRKDLIAENAILRQQLIVLKRQVKRPKFTNGDRLRLVFLSRLNKFWDSALYLVQPQTVLRWHRNLFRRYWKRKSRPKNRKPRIPQETIDLIKEMAENNWLWGAEKLQGELLKLGIKVSKRTIQKYMKKVRKRSSQNWRTFLKNHAHEIWACDFTTVTSLFFKPIYIFVIMELKSRRIVHTAITLSPTDEWTAQQLREATPWDNRPKYLIRDNDNKFGKKFSAVAKSSGIEELKTPFQAPKANAHCERLIGTMKRECLDHFLILNQYQLKRIVTAFAGYYNQHRPHQGIKQRIPAKLSQPRSQLSNQVKGKVIATPMLNGLHLSYAYATC